MKKFFKTLLISVSFLMIGCSSDDDSDNGEDTKNEFAPSELSFTEISKTQVMISWKDNSLDETKFSVFRGVGGDTLSEYLIIPSDSTSFTDTVDPEFSYKYSIKAVTEAETYESDVMIVTYQDPGGTTFNTKNSDDIETFAINSDLTKIATGSDNGNITVFDVTQYDPNDFNLEKDYSIWQGSHSTTPDKIIFSPDGAILLSKSSTGLKVWDSLSGSLIWNNLIQFDNIEFVNNGDNILGYGNSTLTLFDSQNGNTIWSKDNIDNAVFLSNGTNVFCTKLGEFVNIDISTGDDTWTFTNSPNEIKLSEDGSIVVGQFGTNQIIIFNSADGSIKSSFTHNSEIDNSLLSGDGSVFVTMNTNPLFLKFSDTETGAELSSFTIDENVELSEMKISQDGSLISGDYSQRGNVWNNIGNKVISHYYDSSHEITVFSKDGSKFGMAGRNRSFPSGYYSVLDIYTPSGDEIYEFQDHSGSLKKVSFLENENSIFLTTSSKELYILDLNEKWILSSN